MKASAKPKKKRKNKKKGNDKKVKKTAAVQFGGLKKIELKGDSSLAKAALGLAAIEIFKMNSAMAAT
jgi:hypothetical protein